MGINADRIRELTDQIKEDRPVIHCITNMVTVNDCANILLAAGASPTMAHHSLETAEIAAGANALVCNMGAVGDFNAMMNAAGAAAAHGKPVVLDPVGAAGASFRREKCLEFITEARPFCIRGNASEIRALYENKKTAAGVDAAEPACVKTGNLVEITRSYAKKSGCIVVASGSTDLISDGERVFGIENGSGLMTRITGAGCMSSVLLGAFLSMENSLEAVLAAGIVMGICGERAEKWTKECGGGTMTFKNRLIDEVYLLTEGKEISGIRCKELESC